MPANFYTWDGDNKRWRVQIDGRRIVRSVRQLKKDGYLDPAAPETKEASHRAFANWLDDQGRQVAKAIERPHAAVAEVLDGRKEWAVGQGDADSVRAIDQDLAMLTPDLHPSMGNSLLGGQESQAVWRDRLDREKRSPAPANKKVGFQVARWVALQKAKAGAGEITPAESENRRHAIASFESWIGPAISVDKIDEGRWTDFYSHLLQMMTEGKLSRSYAEKLLRYARQFLDWLDSEGLIRSPRNLLKLKIKQRTVAVEVMPLDDVRRLVTTAAGPLKLHLYLMVNCGFTQQDVSDLHPSEFKNGCLVRKRSKTRDEANVPTVSYRLWPETLELLERYKSTDPNHLLLTKGGVAWVRKELRKGKFIEADSIRTLYSRHAKNIGIKMSMKYLRKTSATMIDREFGDRTATLFLGHSPRSIKDRHYSLPAEDALDEALAWLRGVYFPGI